MALALLALRDRAGACASGDDDAARHARQPKRATRVRRTSSRPGATQRVAELAAPDGWTSLIGLHWIEPGSHYVGSDADNGIRLAMGPAHLGMFDRTRRRACASSPDSGVALTLDGEPLTRRDRAAAPTPTKAARA